jgi:putative ABC transport system permease protein
MFVLEGLLLSVIGSLAGGVLGVGGLHYLATLPKLQGFIEFHVTPEFLIRVSAAAIALGIIGSIYPAWRAIKLDPVDALRAE